MVEIYDSKEKERTMWQPRASDPELEAEFLRRLMIKLGMKEEQTKALISADISKTSARITTVNGESVVQIDEGFDRAWRRVGLSLDRTGFTVEDRDRSQGVYFVRYVAPTSDKSEPGFLGKLFGNSKTEDAPLKYRIAIVTQEKSSSVSVRDAGGKPDTSINAQRILKVIADDLK
jgi:outer membrane protein assembly factor BamC